MRKMFRMQYEPCNGQCYAEGDVLPLTDISPDRIEMILGLLTEIHEPACGNSNIRYAIDKDDDTGTHVAVFVHYGKIETFIAPTLVSVVLTLAFAALAHYQSPAWQEELKQGGAQGHGVCHHGEDNDLRRFMIEHGGLEPKVKAEMLARLAA